MMRRRVATQVLLALIAGALIVLFGALGFWQLDRAAQKEADVARHSARGESPPLPGDALYQAALEPQAVRFHRVRLAGRYDGARQFLLDNRTRAGVAGYEVYTALLAGDERPAVLVNRGWVPAGTRRDELPDVRIDSAPREVLGTVDLPRENTFLLGTAGYEQSTWPRVVQRMEPAEVAAALDLDVAPVVVRLDPAQADGFERHWPAYLGIGPERHRAYAFQWFALAATLLVIVLVLARRASRNRLPEER